MQAYYWKLLGPKKICVNCKQRKIAQVTQISIGSVYGLKKLYGIIIEYI